MREFLYIDPDGRETLRSVKLERFDDVINSTLGQRLDKAGLEGWRQRWRIPVSDTAGRSTCLYLKRFLAPPLKRQIQRWLSGDFQKSTAHIEFSNCRVLAERKIGAPRTLAMGERLIGFCERASFLILQEVRGESLEKLADRTVLESGRVNERQLKALAHFVARFHREGFVHRDLYLCHIFLAEGGGGSDPDDFILIDLQRVFRPSWRRLRWIVKDLAALDSSTPQAILGKWGRLRFLAAYARVHSNAGPTRVLASRIARRAGNLQKRSRAITAGGSSGNPGATTTAAKLVRSSS